MTEPTGHAGYVMSFGLPIGSSVGQSSSIGFFPSLTMQDQDSQMNGE